MKTVPAIYQLPNNLLAVISLAESIKTDGAVLFPILPVAITFLPCSFLVP